MFFHTDQGSWLSVAKSLEQILAVRDDDYNFSSDESSEDSKTVAFLDVCDK